jgi:hypothetical protein
MRSQEFWWFDPRKIRKGGRFTQKVPKIGGTACHDALLSSRNPWIFSAGGYFVFVVGFAVFIWLPFAVTVQILSLEQNCACFSQSDLMETRHCSPDNSSKSAGLDCRITFLENSLVSCGCLVVLEGYAAYGNRSVNFGPGSFQGRSAMIHRCCLCNLSVTVSLGFCIYKLWMARANDNSKHSA